ncbi:GNAT family N-acetyltransferase [Zooshikella harenae]|uniref:GNAT family N-acetyltransferase n=1 Tax=Zooshikella harenae TaxID=2827238 RepID=A0ABS5ZHH6_9GAMM|nr:GNAT family N-acetyltransferase [Zooshikella harenae]MBU2712741.1 GNAT family N-acetyltransferase [Zooshikella harenae]
MIKPYTPSDIESVLSIWLEASVQSHTFINRSFWESKINDMRSIYIPQSETYVYNLDSEIVGFISLYQTTLATLFISPNHQGKGFGTQLLSNAKSLRNKLQLAVYKDNHKSTLFYKHNGFQYLYEQTDKHTGFPEIIMSWHNNKL